MMADILEQRLGTSCAEERHHTWISSSPAVKYCQLDPAEYPKARDGNLQLCQRSRTLLSVRLIGVNQSIDA